MSKEVRQDWEGKLVGSNTALSWERVVSFGNILNKRLKVVVSMGREPMESCIICAQIFSSHWNPGMTHPCVWFDMPLSFWACWSQPGYSHLAKPFLCFEYQQCIRCVICHLYTDIVTYILTLSTWHLFTLLSLSPAAECSLLSHFLTPWFYYFYKCCILLLRVLNQTYGWVWTRGGSPNPLEGETSFGCQEYNNTEDKTLALSFFNDWFITWVRSW